MASTIGCHCLAKTKTAGPGPTCRSPFDTDCSVDPHPNRQDEQRPYLLHADDDDPAGKDRIRRYLLIAGGACALLGMAALIYVAAVVRATPSVEALRGVRYAQPSVLLAADGRPLATLRLALQQRVELERVSPWVVKALLATEDRRFFEHGGIDVRRTVSASFRTV